MNATMTIRAAVLRAHGAMAPFADSRPLQVTNVSLAAPGPGEVRVRIRAAGLCHSDLSTVNGDRLRPVPMVLGHEAAGTVERLGDGVDDLRIGQPVVMVFMPSCGHCSPCVDGRPALCEPGAQANGAGTLLGGSRRISLVGEPGHASPVHHHLGVSAFAEYATVSRRSLVPIPEDLPMDVAALFGCAVLTGVGAAVNTARVAPGDRVAVLGLGGVGMSALLGALACGASQVIAIDLQKDKLELARELGATDTFDAGDPDLVERVRDATRGGVDHALEMAGSVAALETAWRISRRGGQTVSAGLPHPDRRFALPATQLVAEERTLKGSYIGSCVPARDVPRFIDMYSRGRLPVDRLMGERLALDDINAGFDRLARGSALRQLIIF
jgi:Zn-dependent alcohol dehydrogenase